MVSPASPATPPGRTQLRALLGADSGHHDLFRSGDEIFGSFVTEPRENEHEEEAEDPKEDSRCLSRS